MWSFYNTSELPQTDHERLEFLWLHHLRAAQGGSDKDAAIFLGLLSWCLQQNCTTSRMREWLSDVLIGIADASPGKERERATRELFLLGRRAGRHARYEAEHLEYKRGRWIWLQLGDVPDNELHKRVADLLAQVDQEAPDPRPYVKAYRKFREAIRQLDARQAGKSE